MASGGTECNMECIIKLLIADIYTKTSIKTTVILQEDTRDYLGLNLDYVGYEDDGSFHFTLTLQSRATTLTALAKFIEAEQNVNLNLPVINFDDDNISLAQKQMADFRLDDMNVYKYYIEANYEDVEVIKEDITSYKKVYNLYVEVR